MDTYTKNSVRFVLSYLSHVPGLRTCHLVKISNFEAHADMNITFPQVQVPTNWLYATKGMRINTSRGHLLLCHLLQGFQVFEVRNVKMKR